jgi:hypothetical protein
MPVELRDGWDTWATSQFKNALQRAGHHFLNTIRSGASPNACLDGWLPDDSEYFQVTAARMTAARPILDVRRAFSGFFSASLIVVPGTTPPSRSSAAGPSAWRRG